MLLYGDFQGRRTISTLLCAAGDRPQPERTTNGRPPGKIRLGGVRLSQQPRLHKLHNLSLWAALPLHPLFIKFFVNFCVFCPISPFYSPFSLNYTFHFSFGTLLAE